MSSLHIVRPIIERLESARPQTKARAVDGVLGLAAALDGLRVSPSQFVIRTSGTARPSAGNTYVVIQDREISFDVITGTTLAGLPNATDELDETSAATIAALVGWQHPAGDGLVEFRSEGIAQLNFPRSLHFWRQSFVFALTLRSLP